jgi:formate dehydrogenase major subunit/NADH-quinone oxidoreductase subunit G
MIKLTINNQEITAKPGEKILWVALDNGIYIPNLCAIREKETPNATCRLCFVEIELNNERRIVTACSEPVKEGMRVYTATEKVRRLQRTAFELLMSEHQIDCSNCWARKRCELLKIAAYLKLKINNKRFRKIEKILR